MVTGSPLADTFELHTRSTSYMIRPTDSRSGLQMVAWGAIGSAQPHSAPPLVSGFETSEDLLPHEFGVGGTRHVLESELLLRLPDGLAGASVRLAGDPYVIEEGHRQVLRCTLVDSAVGLEIELGWSTSRLHDVVTRSAVVRNTGSGELTLDRALSGAFNMPLPDGAAIDAFSGGWCEEFTPRRILLPHGSFRIGSRQGIASHLWTPVITLADPSAPEGECWSVSVNWSGSWQMDVHATSRAGWVRVSAGVDDESPIILHPGESFVAPELLGLWAASTQKATDRWHEYQRTELLRSTDPVHRRVSYNSWYATEFDVRADQQLALAEVAADLGCEMFVLDDGWFKGRTSDAAGLGDWTPDPDAFPHGLEPLIEAVHRMGMRFGLWIEPEGVNPDSDLFRAHPEWIHRSPLREPVMVRNQYVLDLSKPTVEAWVLATLRRLLDGSDIDHLKWDMNRPITDAGRPGSIPGASLIGHARAYQRILDALRRDYPTVTLETCSAGGARVTNSTLSRSDVVWPSDETGPRDRLAIQDGFLSVFPAAAMSSWVTHLDGVRDATEASLEYRFAVAMCGVLGLGADLTTWSPAERDTARRLIGLYKDIRTVVFDGNVRRHGDPRCHGYAVEFQGPEDDPRTVLFVFGRPETTDPVSLYLEARYQSPVNCHLGAARWIGDDLQVTMHQGVGTAILTLG